MNQHKLTLEGGKKVWAAKVARRGNFYSKYWHHKCFRKKYCMKELKAIIN